MAEFKAFLPFDYHLIDLYEGFEHAEFVPDTSDPDHMFYVYPSATTAVTIQGDGFKYLPNGVPYKGTTTSAGLFVDNGHGAYKLGYVLDDVSITSGQAAKYIGMKPKDVAADLFKGNDTFIGSKYDDSLNGLGGHDVLTGGRGADSFYFTSAASVKNSDVITDFKHHQDHIKLSKSIFHGVTSDNLSKTFHNITHHAEDGDDRLLYRVDKHGNGTLSYDSDGKGGHAAVTIAVLHHDAHHHAPVLTASDILLV